MPLPHYLRACCLALVIAPAATGQQVQHGLRVPAGFEVTEYADSSLANDIYTMTVDPQGRIVVASRGYIRVLVDRDGDGKADTFIPFADTPKDGAMGLFWEGKHLYCTGDGGLRRFTSTLRDGRVDGPSELLHPLKTGGEHDAHAIRRGPDGWLYVLCGNNANVDRLVKPAATSPIQKPVAGTVLRFSPDFAKVEIVAHGFRNAYDMDFNSDGELFTFDSDNERCVSLPWYEPTRFYHVKPGAHHGWLSPQQATFWRLPPYFIDVSAPVCTLGRGSPTGCVCYRHGQFPQKYRGGFFLCDWTFGQVHFVPLKRKGASYEGTPEVFLRSVGDNGFAPTAAVVHPETGDLFVSIGGRGTRGAVYRIRYPGGVRNAKEEARHWQPTPRPSKLDEELIPLLLLQTRSANLFRRRQALESIALHSHLLTANQLASIINENSTVSDPSLIRATALLSGNHPAPEAFAALRMLMKRGSRLSEAERLRAVRGLQIGLGDVGAPEARGTVWEGYTPRQIRDKRLVGLIGVGIDDIFPTGHEELDRELARTLAMIGDELAPALTKMTDRLKADSDPLSDIHYLIVLSRLKTSRTKDITLKVADSLLDLDDKITKRHLNRDSNWPLRMAELHRELARKDPALNDALLAHKDFGRPDHVLWAQTPGFDRKKAAALFLARSARDRDFAWNAGLVRLMGELPDEQALPALRKLWDEVGLNDVILPLLARRPAAVDQPKFLAGLISPSLAVVRQSLAALEKLPFRKDAATLTALVQAMRLLPDGKEEEKTKAQIGRLLRRLTEQSLPEGDKTAWENWLKRTHPKEAAKLGGEDGVDVNAWNKRLADIDWKAGDVERGRAVFTKASCAACHSGSQAMGPDLAGVAGRFSRDDLFTAILRPSKDVSARYRTTVITTEDAKVYQGLIVYEAVDSILLQTGPATTVRLAHKQISDKKLSPLSLMPVGLLDRLADRDIADLHAYLKGLSAPSKPR